MHPSAKLWITPAAVLREEEEGGREGGGGWSVLSPARPDTRQTREELFARPACKRKFCLPPLLGALSTAREERVVRVFSRSDFFPLFFLFFSFFPFLFCERKSLFKWFLGLLKLEENFR